MYEWIWNKKLKCFCARHNPTIRADRYGNVFGGGGGDSVTIQQPAPPPPPSITSTIEDYIRNIPALYQMAEEYQPRFAELQQRIAKQTYPLTAGLQETLAGQALEGIQADVPDFIKEEFLDMRRAQLGQNVASPIGAEDISRRLRAQQFQFQKMNQNLALSLAGRQQLVQPPSQAELLGGFSVPAALGFNQGVFGTQANIYGTQADLAYRQAALSQQRALANQAFVGDIIGGGLGMVGSIAGGYVSNPFAFYRPKQQSASS